MGVATTRLDERLMASLGKLQAGEIRFELVEDLPNGGVLCALPALLALGLLRHSQKTFSLPAGYYPLETIFLSVSFLALARVSSLEALRYQPPGEWGKLLGLDRIPEVRTLRAKLDLLCRDGNTVKQWSSTLATEWMEANPQSAGSLYIDGHVRVYNGKLTELPRRYVARQKLCLRGTTDYWVNAMDGQPFFVVTQAADPGMIKVLEEQIVPRLLEEVPNQPSAQDLQANPYRPRFIIIFDRAGYSPEFFARMWQLRIAVISYHKFPEGEWAQEEFSTQKVQLVNGEKVELNLAERGVCLKNGFWAREMRQLDESGHQTPIISTHFEGTMGGEVVSLYARWCQENFFQYMGKHYGLDRLIEYGTEALPETTVVVNPAWRKKDQEVRRQRALLARQQLQFVALELPPQAQAQTVAGYEQEKGKILEQIEQEKKKLTELKKERKETPHHLTLKELPEAQRFSQLLVTKKHFVDTIKLIAYRAETALVALLREKLARAEDGRSVARQILNSAADLCPNPDQKTLTVRLHRLSSAAHDQALEHMCEELTATETVYPGTELRLIFEPVGSSQFPRNQES